MDGQVNVTENVTFSVIDIEVGDLEQGLRAGGGHGVGG